MRFFIGVFVIVFVVWFVLSTEQKEESQVVQSEPMVNLESDENETYQFTNELELAIEADIRAENEYFTLRKSVEGSLPNAPIILINADKKVKEHGYEAGIFYLKVRLSYVADSKSSFSSENHLGNQNSHVTNVTETTIAIGTLVYENIPFKNAYTWDDAKAYCNQKGSGWRLPRRYELHKLSNLPMYGEYDANYKKWLDQNKVHQKKAVNGRGLFARDEIYQNMRDGYYFWALDSRGDELGWVVDFNLGFDNVYKKTDKIYTLCVRG